MDGIKVRGHHLRNLGYLLWRFGPSNLRSKNYSEFYEYYHKSHYVEAIFKKIIENPHLEITITDYLDEICFACGKNDGIGCTKSTDDEKELKLLDRETAGEHGLTIGRSYSSDRLLFKLMQNIDV